MSKKKKQFKETTIEDFYDLKVDKVDELVSILKGEETESEVSMNISDCTGVDDPKNKTRFGKEKQFDPYKIDKFSRIPAWIKALFIKWWFSGLVCYFVMFGLNMSNRSDGLDSIVLCGLVMGLIVDILVNPLFRYMESDKKEYNAFMMFPFPFKAFWTFFTNLLYYVFVLVGVNYLYAGFNELINIIAGTKTNIYIGVEPLLFGLFSVIVDMAFIGIKDGVVCLIKKRKNKEKEGVVNV